MEDVGERPPESALLEWLQAWYLSQCDGEWEHDYGVSIGTLDNPGWFLKVSLKGTDSEGRSMLPYERHAAEDDWVVCSVEDGEFRGFGDGRKLGEILRRFRCWMEQGRGPEEPGG